MNLKIVLIVLLLMSSHFKDTSACSLKNTTCVDIKTAAGFEFSYSCANGSQISIENNKTHLAHADLRKDNFESLPEVVKMNGSSVTTKHCRDLIVKCLEGPDDHVTETCVEFKVIGNPDFFVPPTRWNLVLAAAVILCVVGILIIILGGCFVCWKKEQNIQENTETASFFKFLISGSYIRKRISLRNRSQIGSGFQLVEVADLENQLNGHIWNGRDLSGRDENENNQNITLESVYSSGDTEVPNITSPSHIRAMNRNSREDPVGINGTKNTNKSVDDDQPVGDHNAGDHEATEQPLLPDQRAAGGGLDMTSEAEALVNKHGFDLDHVNGRARAPELDVESTC